MESNTNSREFKKFIENDRSIRSTHKPFLLGWVEMYLEIIEQERIPDKHEDEKLKIFLSELSRKEKYQKWQIKQVIDAVNNSKIRVIWLSKLSSDSLLSFTSL